MAYTTIDKPDLYFNTKLYTGNGSTQSITGVNFQPDLIWLKNRDGAFAHILTDIVRGNTKSLGSNTTDAEVTATNRITSFDSDGFSVGNAGGSINANAQNIVAWNWLADNTSGSSNTDGSITSTVSANTTSGFSIVTYTGNNTDNATVGHGLGSVPSMVITKSRSVVSLTGWMTKHKDLASNYNVALNRTDAAWNPSSNGWVGDLNSSSFFTLKNGTTNGNNANQSGATYIAYCFAEKKGFSKFGSYTGNGNADGTFVYTGFKPAFVMIKRTDAAFGWFIFDTKRDTFNVASKYLLPYASDAEASLTTLDILSNGFKIRQSLTYINASGGTYIYMAFASNPFVTSTGVPTTAR
jgi:hypothetical protein